MILKSLQHSSILLQKMSIIIVACIKQLEVEENVYRRRGKCVTVKSFNNDVRNRKKISEKWAYQKLQFVCPHYGMREHRMHKFKRLNQNVMPKNFLVQIQFVFKMDVQKYQISSVELEHKHHPVSEEHIKTYARKH